MWDYYIIVAFSKRWRQGTRIYGATEDHNIVLSQEIFGF